LRLPKGTSALPIERDAWAFLDAAGITSALQQRAIVQLVRDLKKANLWTKMKAVYPFVGGTATTHKWNLKNPQDTDAAFRMLWEGGITHNASGITGNGTTGRGVTYLVPSTAFSAGSAHVSAYVSTNLEGPRNEYGLFDATNTNAMSFNTSEQSGVVDGTGNHVSIIGHQANNRIIVLRTGNAGFHTSTRTSTTTLKMFVNDAQIGATNTVAYNNFSTLTGNMYFNVAALFNGTAFTNYNTRTISFFSLGDGLTDSEVALFNSSVQRYQKTLGRSV
jgi:hypothetical protein